MFPDPHHYKLLKLIEANPAIQQREMAKAMDVSLGKARVGRRQGSIGLGYVGLPLAAEFGKKLKATGNIQ